MSEEFPFRIKRYRLKTGHDWWEKIPVCISCWFKSPKPRRLTYISVHDQTYGLSKKIARLSVGAVLLAGNKRFSGGTHVLEDARVVESLFDS
jgi:hypothetical protein